MEKYDFTVTVDTEGIRLDVCISSRLEDLSRAFVQRLVSDGHVLVNSQTSRSSYKVQAGDLIHVTVPPPQKSEVAAEDIPLETVYEDEHIIVINKPHDMVVHPAPGSKSGTLVNAVLAHSDDLSGIGGVERPGIVHRLDKDTTGLLVVAKTDEAHQDLQEQIQSRSAKRSYKGIVWGETSFNEAVVDAPIGRHPTDRKKMAIIKDRKRYTARDAKTRVSVIERFSYFTYLEFDLETGRTHQIRVHSSFIGHPIVGDETYGGAKRHVPPGMGKRLQAECQKLISSLHGQALHAYRLSFVHPHTRKELDFTVPEPVDMRDLLDFLRKNLGTNQDK